MDGFERRRERKKESIIKASLELFSTYGIQKVSIGEIAKKANVSQVTIYNYFGSKDELIKEVMRSYMNGKIEEFEELLTKDIPFPEKVKLLVFEKKESNNFLDDETQVLTVLQDPSVQEFREDYYKNKSLPLLMSFIEQGRKEGYLKPDISIEAIMLFLGTFNEMMSKPGFFSEQNKRLRLDIADLMFYGLFGISPDQR